MGATEETVERLLEDLGNLEDVEIATRTSDGLFGSYYRGTHGPVQTFPQLMFAFQHLYVEQGEPIAARFARWEELRAKYGGRDKLRVENGRLIPLAEGES